MSVKLIKDNMAEFLAGVNAMDKKRVYVGVPGNESERSEDITNVSLAYIHDRGSPKVNIPARPFLQPGIDSARAQIEARMKKAAASPNWSPALLDQTLEQVGTIAQSSVKKQIRSQEGFTPLAKSTLKAREKKGFKGTKALIHTGKLLNSISYVVRDK